MAHLSLSLLGSFQATLDGEPINEFESTKVRALLAYLAVEAHRCPDGHPRQALATLLWPDKPERAALANLRNALANLRSAIGDRTASPPFLSISRETIQLNLASDHWLDVTAFRALLETAEADRPAPQRLQEAIALYRGDLLEGFFVRGSPGFDDWVLLLRERLHCQALEALVTLAAYHEGRGSYQEAIACARRQVAIEPWQEDAHRQLMRTLALSGERTAALAQYETCRRALAQELGIEPEPETQVLYKRIRDGKLQARSSHPTHNLPAQLTPFIGRRALLAEIAEQIADSTCRLLTLVGPGGCGKSRLALEVAKRVLSERVSERFADGVCFVPLVAVQSMQGMVSAIAQAVGFSFYEGREPRQQLFDYVRNKRMLLVLDNMEHLLSHPLGGTIGGVALVTGLLGAAPGIQIVTTSRARLNVRGEHLVHIEGMRYPQTLSETASDLDQYSAVQLFWTSAREVRPDIEVTADDLAHVARICQLVQGMPLAILLAAAWVELLAPAEIAAEISRSLDFLETDAHDVPGRQRSIRAVFDHSWDLLSEREQEIFAGLSVFRGGFTRQAAQRVTGISLRELMGLVNKSLLHRASTGRCTIHELLRQYAAEKFDGSPDGGNAVHDRHSAYYCDALQTWEAGLKGARKVATLAEMDAEVENARAAWDWAVERGHVERLSQAIDGLCRFYVCRGRYQEGEVLCRRTAKVLASHERSSRCKPSLREKESLVLAQVLAWQGVFGRILGRTELARQLLEDSLALLDRPAMAGQSVEERKAFILWELGYTAHQLGEAKEAKHLAARSLATYRALGDRWGTSRALWFLGSLATWANAYQEARRLHRESLAIRRELGDPSEIAESLVALGRIAYSQEQLVEAEDLIRQGLAIYRQAGDRPGIAWGLHFLANLEQGRGNYAQVASLEAQSMDIYRELGYRRHLATALTALGVAEMNLGRYEQARAHLRMSLATHREINHPHGVAVALWCLGAEALARKAYAEAHRTLHESLAICRKIGYPRELGYLLVCLGMAECELGRLGQAQPYLCEGLRLVAESRHFYAAFAIPGIAMLYACRGEDARAVELYALASRYSLVANSCSLEDIAGRHIAAVAATLSPDLVAAAQERGRARDLWATIEELLEELELKEVRQ